MANEHCAEATVSAVDSWPLNGLTPTQAVSDDPTDERRLLSFRFPALLVPPLLLQDSFRALDRRMCVVPPFRSCL